MEVLFKEVTLNREPEAVVELIECCRTHQNFVGVALCSILPQRKDHTHSRGGGGGGGELLGVGG